MDVVNFYRWETAGRIVACINLHSSAVSVSAGTTGDRIDRRISPVNQALYKLVFTTSDHAHSIRKFPSPGYATGVYVFAVCLFVCWQCARVCAWQATGLERVGLWLWNDVDVGHAEEQSLTGCRHLRTAVQYGGKITAQRPQRHRLSWVAYLCTLRPRYTPCLKKRLSLIR